MHNWRAKKELTLVFDESGATAIFIALIFSVICGFVGLAVDLGHYYKVRAELQRTADAGALAGASGLVPYTGPAPQTPNWMGGVTAANTIISKDANKVDNPKVTPEGTVAYGYWLFNPPIGQEQTLPHARPGTETWLPTPAIKVTLIKNVTMYLAPLIGFPGPMQAIAAATAILPETYHITGSPPIALDWDTVYNLVGGTVQIDVTEQNIKPQSNKGIAGWINLSGDNTPLSVRISAPMIADPTGVLTNSKVYTAPGTMANLTDLISVGETIVLPVVQDMVQKQWLNIMDWGAFKVDSVSANSMTGHFVPIYYSPDAKPDSRPVGNPATPFISGTPKLVSP